MENRVKSILCEAFSAPSPKRKKEFLAQISLSGRESMWYEMIPTQIRFIHKGAWFLALVVFASTLFFVSSKEPQTVFLAAALSPFLALAVLVESNRSHHYNMTELESATKLSLRSVVLCRMLILGVFGLLVLVFMAAMTQLRTGYHLLLTGAYILLPYLITMWTGLQIERSRLGRELPYATACISIVVSVAVLYMANSNSNMFNPVYGMWWEAATIILIIAVAISVKNKVRLLEEPAWS